MSRISPFQGYAIYDLPVFAGSVAAPNNPAFGLSSVFGASLTPPNKLGFSSAGLSLLFVSSVANKLAFGVSRFGVSLLEPKRLGFGGVEHFAIFEKLVFV